MHNVKSKKNSPIEPQRSVDKYFSAMDHTFSRGHKGLYGFFLLLAFFGVMGLIWMIPFPQFSFLVKMNMHTFLNWGSIFIAVVIYSYLKLAPTLSYAVLFCIGIMSFFIVQLEYVERDGGPSVVLVSSIFAAVGLLGLFLATKKEDKINGKDYFEMLTIGPIWLWSKVFAKFRIKF